MNKGRLRTTDLDNEDENASPKTLRNDNNTSS